MPDTLGAMWMHLWRLLWRALLDTPSVLSSNWVAVVFSILVFGILQLRQLGKYGLSQVIKEWKENVGFGVVVVVAAWSLVFWISVVNTIYRDHQSLVAKRKEAERTIGTVTTDRDNWKQQFEELRQHPPRPPAANKGDGMQPSKVGPVTMTFSQYQSIRPDAPYCHKLVFTSVVPVKSLGLDISMSAPVKYSDSLITFVFKGWTKVSEHDSNTVELVVVGFAGGDALSPERPVSIAVCSDHPFVPTKVGRRNVVEE